MALTEGLRLAGIGVPVLPNSTCLAPYVIDNIGFEDLPMHLVTMNANQDKNHTTIPVHRLEGHLLNDDRLLVDHKLLLAVVSFVTGKKSRGSHPRFNLLQSSSAGRGIYDQ